MNQQEFFERVLRALERLEIPYMVAGSVGAIAYGDPRLTNDLDVVVDLNAAKVERLAEEFRPPDFYFPPSPSILEEIRRRGQFNVLHVDSGSKADLIIKKDTEFASAEFARRRKVPFTQGFSASTASPEDVILSKLHFFKSGGSEKHLRDIAGVLQVSGPGLDLAHIERWVAKLHLEDSWQAARKMASGKV